MKRKKSAAGSLDLFAPEAVETVPPAEASVAEPVASTIAAEPAATTIAAEPIITAVEAKPPTRANAEERELADQDQRDLIRTALDETLVVEAAAGTGKTTELVRRMVAILESGRAELDRMVAVTFTEPAAGELKLRLRSEIENARLDSKRAAASRDRLTAALPKLEEARIGTIHSFCADLLRERPVEAGVDPRFQVAAEDAARPLFEHTFHRWFERQLADPSPGVSRILCRWKREPAFLTFGMKDDGPRGLLRRAAKNLIDKRDFPTPWRRVTGFDRDAAIDAILEEMESLAEWASSGNPDDYLVKSLTEIAQYVDEVRRMERNRDSGRDYDALEARLTLWSKKRHWTWTGWRDSRNPEFDQNALREHRDRIRTSLNQFVADSGADLAPRLRDELWPVVEAYEEAKETAGCLDFEDLLLRARDLVRANATVRVDLQRRFTHYFVDEFQDTDPLQAEILMLLAANDPQTTDWRKARPVPGKLFLVGDPKQSIYRFRRADVALYREVQRQVLAAGGRSVHLAVSFRAVPEIQMAVNAAFEPRLSGKDGRGYVPLEPFRRSDPSKPPVIALPVPFPYSDYGKVTKYSIEESLPDVVAAWIDWLVKKSGWMVTERESPTTYVPVEPRHVCILLRRFRSGPKDMTRPYVTALEARGLPHLLVGGSSFHEREEVEALRNALQAIERPDDALSVFATLRGPLFAVRDATLLAWRERVGSIHPLRPVPDDLPESLRAAADCLEILRDLHRNRNYRPVSDTIARLLEATRAHASLAIWPTGMQALANVGRLMDLARRAELHGLVSFRGFVDRIAEDAERGEVAEAPLLEEGIQGVRVMTVHKAKGLEFPVVVLADMTANETFDQPTRWSDPARGLYVQPLAGCIPPELRDHAREEMEHEREEASRLAYVAATRARDVLVAPVLGDDRFDGWLSVLTPALYPGVSRARHPASAEIPGCPSFGDECTLERPSQARMPMFPVAPGLHTPETGAPDVVWWDPANLTLNVPPAIGLMQSEILRADEDGHADAALTSWKQWQEKRDATREMGSRPTRNIRTATEWARGGREVRGVDSVDIVDAIVPGTRPKGVRFGALVHALLSVVDLTEESGVPPHAAVQGRILDASDEEREAAVRIVQSALNHPVLRRAAEAMQRGECRREIPLVFHSEDGTLLEAQPDLAFYEDGVWTVVDFKTDAELDPISETYRRQVALYVRGIVEATGKKARGVIVRL